METRDGLISAFHEAQASSGMNWVSPEACSGLGKRFGLTQAGTRAVASYYSMLSLRPRGRHVIRLCVSPVCRMMGSLDLLGLLESELGVAAGETTKDGLFTLETAQCLGRCAGAPAMMVDGRAFAGLDIRKVRDLLRLIAAEGAAGPPDPASYAADIGPRESLVALRYPALSDPSDLAEYRAAGGYEALKLALARESEELVEEFERAKVRGRGGAGFPTGLKERSTAAGLCEEECERYVVCNADEGEPGTFKDRIIMELEPHLLIEGMLVSGWAIGARRGYVYIRGEYGCAIERVGAAIRSARAAGLLGSRIFGTDFSFDIELREGAGSYLCGEELTLIESLEGKRGYPRIKPPFPAESGLWGKPTLVNNVETLAQLPWVVERGADEYLALGTPSSPGTKIFCVSGDVARPGYGEWELGLSLGELIEAAGGCVSGARPLAVLLGGAAGHFVSGDMLGLPMDYDALRSAGASLGSGAVIVLGPGRSIAAAISSIMDFFEHESCGKCVPCRVGTARLAAEARRLLEMAKAGSSRAERLALLENMVGDAELMAKTSLCPLGQSPVLPLRSARRNLAELV
ncbi:MAG TPA: NAD(P)H-dependent oxidoreductase subunit E [Rectinemataceae bacterium]|nr:NAD(P)H-dependent oxidoreductase subunit E [Rectinemataceae bacterium]